MEGKKSFVIYVSWKLWLDALSDEQKGQWLNWMLDYTNDLNPEYPKDKAVEVACRMAQDTLKRDLKKYNAKVERMQRINEEKKQNKVVEAKNEIETKSKRNRDNIVGDNVNDNVNVNVNDNSKELNNNDLSISKDISKSSGEVSREKPTPLIILPCIGNYQHPIFDEDVKHYKELYPAVDILQQFKNMVGWLEANPQNRKTKNGVKSFIARWLSKCQDKAPKVEEFSYISNSKYANNGGFESLDDDPTVSFGGVEKI